MVSLNPKRAPIDVAFDAAGAFARRVVSFASGGRYDAAKNTKRRKSPDGNLSSEDDALPPEERRKLIAAGRDIHRNFTIAGWAIRKHLDYVSNFTFQCRSGKPEVDTQVEKLMRWWMNPANCDVAGRNSFDTIIRLAELRRTIDGDIFIMKMRDGRLQAIEGDRVRTPYGGIPSDLSINASDLIHGVQTNSFGKAIRYCVCKRGKGSNTFTFERMVPATNLYQFAYFDRFDQVRGISPLSAGINSLRDVYEGFDYALAKLKVSQLFGISFFRDSPKPVGDVSVDSETGHYEVDLGAGPVKLELKAGDRAEFLEAKTPSTEFQSFTQSMIGVAIKALDIPYSFYDESFTNYSGARQALLQYEQSVANKRTQVQALLDHLTAWRISLWIQDGVLDSSLGDLAWEWIPNGIGWIDPLKEIDANIAAINATLDTRSRILREQGRDFYEVARERAAEESYLASLKLPAVVGAENRQPIVEVSSDVTAAA